MALPGGDAGLPDFLGRYSLLMHERGSVVGLRLSTCAVHFAFGHEWFSMKDEVL